MSKTCYAKQDATNHDYWLKFRQTNCENAPCYDQHVIELRAYDQNVNKMSLKRLERRKSTKLDDPKGLHLEMSVKTIQLAAIQNQARENLQEICENVKDTKWSQLHTQLPWNYAY